MIKMDIDSTHVSCPLELPCGYLIPNRIGKAALTEHLAGDDNLPNEAHYRLYKVWSQSGAGLLLTGNIMLDRDCVEGEGNVVIDSYGQLSYLKSWARSGGKYLWLQIGHAGALSNSKRPVSPSGIPYQGKARSFKQSRAMTLDDIQDVKRRYVLVAGMAQEAGFAGIEIHAAHGFLLNQFLSPLTNKRNDRYGGRLSNRARLLVEIVNDIRGKVGADYPIAVKINTNDGTKEGFSENESVTVCKMLEREKVDLIELSGGDYDNTLMIGSNRPGEYFRQFAEYLKSEGVACPIMLTGGIKNLKSIENILDKGIADMIGLGRPMIVDPHIPNKLLDGTVNEVLKNDADNLPVMEQLMWYWEKMRILAK